MSTNELEQVTWEEWLSSYWIATISIYEPTVFIKAFKQKPYDKPYNKDNKGSQFMNTAYFEGKDGYTYLEVRNSITGEIINQPIYKVKNTLGDADEKDTPVEGE